VERVSDRGRLIDRYKAVIETVERTVSRSDAVIRSARDAIVTFTADDYLVVSANPAAMALFRIGDDRQDGLVGLRLHDLIAIDDPPPNRNAPRPLSRLLDGSTRLTWGIGADGTRFLPWN